MRIFVCSFFVHFHPPGTYSDKIWHDGSEHSWRDFRCFKNLNFAVKVSENNFGTPVIQQSFCLLIENHSSWSMQVFFFAFQRPKRNKTTPPLVYMSICYGFLDSSFSIHHKINDNLILNISKKLYQVHLQSKELLPVSPRSIKRHKKPQYARKIGYGALCKRPVSKILGDD